MISEFQLCICLVGAVIVVGLVYPIVENIYLKRQRLKLHKELKAQHKAMKTQRSLMKAIQHDLLEALQGSLPNIQQLPIRGPGMQFVAFLDKEGNIIDENGKPISKHFLSYQIDINKSGGIQ